MAAPATLDILLPVAARFPFGNPHSIQFCYCVLRQCSLSSIRRSRIYLAIRRPTPVATQLP